MCIPALQPGPSLGPAGGHQAVAGRAQGPGDRGDSHRPGTNYLTCLNLSSLLYTSFLSSPGRWWLPTFSAWATRGGGAPPSHSTRQTTTCTRRWQHSRRTRTRRSNPFPRHLDTFISHHFANSFSRLVALHSREAQGLLEAPMQLIFTTTLIMLRSLFWGEIKLFPNELS